LTATAARRGPRRAQRMLAAGAVVAASSAAAAAPAPARAPKQFKWGADMKNLGISTAVGAVIWLLPPPAGVSVQAWHLLAIFLGTIVGIITKPLPLGAVAMLGLGATMLTKTLTFAAAFSAFASEIPCAAPLIPPRPDTACPPCGALECVCAHAGSRFASTPSTGKACSMRAPAAGQSRSTPVGKARLPFATSARRALAPPCCPCGWPLGRKPPCVHTTPLHLVVTRSRAPVRDEPPSAAALGERLAHACKP